MKITICYSFYKINLNYYVPFNIGDVVKVINAKRVLSKTAVKSVFGRKEYDGKTDDRWELFPSNDVLYNNVWKVVDVKSVILLYDIQILLVNRVGHHIVMEQSLDSNDQIIEVIRNGKPKELVKEKTFVKRML